MSTENPYQSPVGASQSTVAGAGRERPVRPLSKVLFFGLLVGAIAATVGLQRWLDIAVGRRNVVDRAQILLLAASIFVPMFLTVFAQSWLLYRMWDAIRDGEPYTTPGRAVGLMLIPVFNLYWAFQAYWGWTKDFNRYAMERSIPAPRMPEGLALTMCVFWALTPVCCPIGNLLTFVAFVLLLVFTNAAINGVNAVAAVNTTYAVQ